MSNDEQSKTDDGQSSLTVGLERIVGYVYERIATGEIEQGYGIRFAKDTAEFYFNHCFGGYKAGTHRMIPLVRSNAKLTSGAHTAPETEK